MLSFSNIYDLASLAVTRFGLQGIDWDALAAKKRASVWDPDYISDYMTPSFQAMMITATSLDLDTNLSDAVMQETYSTVASAVNAAAGSAFKVIGIPMQEAQVALAVDKEAVRKLISMLYSSAVYNYAIHLNETVQHSGLSDSDIQAHANWVCGVMNAITMLDKIGFYSILGIKNTQGQSGLGIAPILVVAGLIALAILAWAIIAYAQMNKVAQQVSHMCDQAQASGNTALTTQCVAALTSPDKNAGTLPVTLIQQILSSVLPYALAGGAIYIAILAAPAVIKNIMASKSSTA